MTIAFKATCDLYDEYLEAARVSTTVFFHFGGIQRFCGNAVTVKCFEDNSRIKELVRTPGEGRVMVVDGGASPRCALVGDVLAAEAQGNGWAGIVVYGCVRDKAQLGELELGVMALAVTPRKSVRCDEGRIDVPIRLGDVWCYPGDEVYADEDGVLLLEAGTT